MDNQTEEQSKPWSSQSFLNLGKSMVIQDTSNPDEKQNTSQLSLIHPDLEMVAPVPMKMDRSECIGDPMTLAGLGSEPEQPKVEALSDNKVDVEIEPDVKSNRVSVNLCSFMISLSCCSKVDKKDL
jgi:hypothetical protein